MAFDLQNFVFNQEVSEQVCDWNVFVTFGQSEVRATSGANLGRTLFLVILIFVFFFFSYCHY